MKSIRARACLIGVFVLTAAVSEAALVSKGSQRVNPVEKVVELLTKLSVKIEAEGKKEAEQYDKYACFCKEQADEKNYLIEKSDKKITMLSAKMAKLDADIAALSSEIADLASRISELDGKIKAAVEIREGQHASYVEKEADISGAIDALVRAIAALKDSKAQLGGDAQLNLAQLARRVLATAVRVSSSRTDAVATLSRLGTRVGRRPTTGVAADYEYQSNDIIATLQDLLVDFKQNKKELDEAEFTENSAFEKNKLNLANEKKFAEKDKAEKEAVVEAKSEELAATTADHDQEVHDRDADSSFLKVLESECETKANQWDQRSQTRAGELTAISKALEALKTSADKFGANKKLVGLTQRSVLPKRKTMAADSASFLQIGRENRAAVSEKAVTEKVIQLLALASKRLNSNVLSAAMLKVEVAADHFVKVRGLINDLIARLKKDAEEEASQKSFCDKEMAAAIGSRDQANGQIETETANINKLNAEQKSLEKEVAELQETIAENTKALAEATELRLQEKKENEKTMADAKEGEEATQLALTVLEEFYGNAFLQYVPPNSDREGKTVGDRAPEVFSGEYHGQQAASKGILGILEVILSDFQKTFDTTKSEEAEAQEAFEGFEEFIKSSIEDMEGQVKSKESRIVEVKDLTVEAEKSLKSAQEKLGLAKEELEKLESMCVKGEETYAERVAARQKEIDALKEALEILDNWQN